MDLTVEEIDRIVRKAVREEGGGCCAARCKEKCGITPHEHSVQHVKLSGLFDLVGSAGRKAMLAGVGVLTLGILAWIGEQALSTMIKAVRGG